MRHISKHTERQPPCLKKGFSRHTGRTKGGLNAKLHAVCDGQVSDFKGADVLLADLPDETEEITCDRIQTATGSGCLSQTGISPPVPR
ncbi:hypothetical protein [Acetobacter thailandicus]|uniref:hypothetical protein n=1 Tax=Acetobacter thailandicus TaxID=1502842 RepID=UPI001BAAC44F|nr:hypothetical protein [Acetobacter thailandicus]MBS0985133.1 hypothetical protein [Acetobacter thailandicus]